MDLANASMYDGATSMAEAAILSYGANGRTKVAVSSAVHPHYRQVLETYAWAIGLEVVEVQHESGVTANLAKLDDQSACLIVQSPNFFGNIEDLAAARRAADKAGALLVVVADP